MARIKTIQAAFSAGEVSDGFEGRIDLDVYAKAARKLRNVYVDNIGFIFRREGLKYIDNTDGDQAARIAPFEFNTEQVYLFEFTPGKLRVFENEVEIFSDVASAPITGLTADIIQEMDITQSADTMLVVHESIAPFRVTRTGPATFVTDNIPLTNIPEFNFPDTVGVGTDEVMRLNISFDSANASFVLILEGERTDGISMNNAAAASNAAAIQAALRNLAVTSDTGITVVDVDINNYDITFGGDDGDRDWITPQIVDSFGVQTVSVSSTTQGGAPTEPVWSATRGWPRSITFFEGRLWFGGSLSRPQTLWGSVIGDFFNFNVGTGLGDQALDLTIDDDQVNAINSVTAGRTLNIFTTGGEFAIVKDFSDPVTPTNIVLRKQTLHGSKQVRPVSIDGSVIFPESSGNVLREFVFNDFEQSFNAPNISVLSADIVRDAVRMAVRRSVDDASVSYTYIVNSDGTMAVLNKLREQELRAFSLFETEGNFEDVAVVGGEVFVTVARVIDGSNVRFIEKLDREYFLDASAQVTVGAATDTFAALAPHLANETVTVLGALEPDELNFSLLDNTLNGTGDLTTEFELKKPEVGIFFAAEIETLPIEGILGQSQTMGDYKRMTRINVRMQESRNLIVTAGRCTYKPPFRQMGSTVLDQPIPLFTGWKNVRIGGIDRDVTVTITQEEPFEFKVLAATIDVAL